MINVVVPMAGAGRRFVQRGYAVPKPFVEIGGEPMVSWALKGLLFADARYIFVAQQKHVEEFPGQFDLLLEHARLVSGNEPELVKLPGLTEGAACSVLAAERHIDTDVPLFIANCDQVVEWDLSGFEDKFLSYPPEGPGGYDGCIITVSSARADFSYAKVGPEGFVVQTMEKNPFSPHATVGYYFWSKGSVFCQSARAMIEVNDRTNNEFYVCPVYNHTLALGFSRVGIYPATTMWCLGTPEDLKEFRLEARET
jgi:NDP-sugar pyrophosphorylase family protein